MTTIKEKAKKAATRIIEWCYLKEREGLDDNLPTHVIENLLTEQKESDINNACEAYKRVLIRHYGQLSYDRMEGQMKILINKFREELEE